MNIDRPHANIYTGQAALLMFPRGLACPRQLRLSPGRETERDITYD